jgi:hypothetical protein
MTLTRPGSALGIRAIALLRLANTRMSGAW